MLPTTIARKPARPAPRTPRYRIEVSKSSPHDTVVHAEGDLDMTARAEFASTLSGLTRAGHRIVVDLSGATFVYSEIVSTLSDVDRLRPGTVEVVAPTRQVRMLLDILAPELAITGRGSLVGASAA